MLLLRAQNAAIPDFAPHAYFCALGEGAERAARKLAERLRDELPGLRLTFNAGGGKLKSQLARADRAGARYALILGETETAAQTVQVKSLRSEQSQTPNQSEVRWAELSQTLRGLLHF